MLLLTIRNAAADASVCGAVTRDDVASVVIKALLSEKADGKVSKHAMHFVSLLLAPQVMSCCLFNPSDLGSQ